MKFHLEYESLLQGNFTLHEKNVAYIFQVNCPGCFIYGFPIINTWYKKHVGQVGFIGISTCFEDFELNTKKNTQDLLSQGQMIGETSKYFAQHHIQKYSDVPEFPVVFDATTTPEEYLTDENVNSICQSMVGYDKWSIQQHKEMKLRIKEYYNSHPKIAMTFSINQLKGTPSYVMFDQNYTVINSFFGQLPSEDLSYYFGNV